MIAEWHLTVDPLSAGITGLVALIGLVSALLARAHKRGRQEQTLEGLRADVQNLKGGVEEKLDEMKEQLSAFGEKNDREHAEIEHKNMQEHGLIWNAISTERERLNQTREDVISLKTEREARRKGNLR